MIDIQQKAANKLSKNKKQTRKNRKFISIICYTLKTTKSTYAAAPNDTVVKSLLKSSIHDMNGTFALTTSILIIHSGYAKLITYATYLIRIFW